MKSKSSIHHCTVWFTDSVCNESNGCSWCVKIIHSSLHCRIHKVKYTCCDILQRNSIQRKQREDHIDECVIDVNHTIRFTTAMKNSWHKEFPTSDSSKNFDDLDIDSWSMRYFVLIIMLVVTMFFSVQLSIGLGMLISFVLFVWEYGHYNQIRATFTGNDLHSNAQVLHTKWLMSSEPCNSGEIFDKWLVKRSLWRCWKVICSLELRSTSSKIWTRIFTKSEKQNIWYVFLSHSSFYRTARFVLETVGSPVRASENGSREHRLILSGTAGLFARITGFCVTQNPVIRANKPAVPDKIKHPPPLHVIPLSTWSPSVCVQDTFCPADPYYLLDFGY